MGYNILMSLLFLLIEGIITYRILKKQEQLVMRAYATNLIALFIFILATLVFLIRSIMALIG